VGTRDVVLAVPMRFAGVDLLIEATDLRAVGAEPTSAASRVADAYQQVEKAILGVATSFAKTIAELDDEVAKPREASVEFGLAISLEGDIVLVKGSAEATLSISLTYDIDR
jgi:Trypsin-co-occurring domain 1